MANKLSTLASLLATALAACPQAQAESCYRLKDAHGKIVYQSETPPFDLSYPPFSKAYEASRARGESLIIEEGAECFDAERYAAQREMAKILAWDRANAAPVGEDERPRSRASAPTPEPETSTRRPEPQPETTAPATVPLYGGAQPSTAQPLAQPTPPPAPPPPPPPATSSGAFGLQPSPSAGSSGAFGFTLSDPKKR
jgi:hypothetical protein